MDWSKFILSFVVLWFSSCKTTPTTITLPVDKCPDQKMEGYIVNTDGQKLDGRIACNCDAMGPISFTIDAPGGDQFEANAEELIVVHLQESGASLTYTKIPNSTEKHLSKIEFTSESFQIFTNLKSGSDQTFILYKNGMSYPIKNDQICEMIKNHFSDCEPLIKNECNYDSWQGFIQSMSNSADKCK
ncbi:MAG: hypothetical protein KA767_04650 [Saprospiraceae bacterium]|nr:hypothetical protein [Saprospiraceae bacterium]HMS69702.1 hypothetical protein [Saprospiraceae bacterium]